MSEPIESEELTMAGVAARAGESKGASDIIVLDVAQILGICDYFVIMTVSSVPMAKAVTDEVERSIHERFSLKPRSVEGSEDRTWTLVDYGDIVVHVFAERERDYYRIERLYADAPRVDWAGSGSDSP